MTYWNTSSDKLTFPTEPLALRDKRHPVALLVDGKVAPVAKHNRIRILAVPVVADHAQAVLLLAGRGLPVDSSG